MAISSSSPPDPPSTTPTPRIFSNPPPTQRDTRPPTPQVHHYPPPSAYLPNIAPRVVPLSTNPRFSKPHDPSQGILYPVASSGRNFLSRPIRCPQPQPTDQTVTVANAAAFPPRPVVSYSHPHSVRLFGSGHSDPHGQPLHLIRPTHLQHTLLGSTAGGSGSVMSGVVKGVPVSTHLKVASSPLSNPDLNGYKDIRDRSRDDSFATVRDRKVKISDGASLYALCRSWLRNGFPEESQPQYIDGVKSLPRPLPVPVGDAHSPGKKEGDQEEEDEGLLDNLSPQDLLQKHIKRAKRVRARLREERLRRIERYKTRLALLLPPIVEQQFRNDKAAGN